MGSVEPAEMIADLRRRAQCLLDAARTIEEAYGLKTTEKPQENESNGSVALADRRQQLIAYLRKNGPTKRAKIVHDTGIPVGTVSALVKDPVFYAERHGVWGAKEAK